jgi:hypothetical protein
MFVVKYVHGSENNLPTNAEVNMHSFPGIAHLYSVLLAFTNGETINIFCFPKGQVTKAQWQ